MMQNFFISIIFILTPLSAAWANSDCIKGIGKVDMCAKARSLSNEIASMLPMQMSQNMSWESVMAAGSTIQAHIRLSYDKNHLESAIKQAGVPLSNVKQAIQKSARNVCLENTPTRAFIDLGGSFKYIYSYIDGNQFMTASVSKCN
ncbi:hypothetical protein [Comamonas testosteroni]|uniref:hypothetical protein n=1 Tax=Comamonas testosteroni TaxID=285 RepID=UPI0026ECC113|nr:hypothetical protein [Comamonas testosteroni]